jgi:hypothetical protein
MAEDTIVGACVARIWKLVMGGGARTVSRMLLLMRAGHAAACSWEKGEGGQCSV